MQQYLADVEELDAMKWNGSSDGIPKLKVRWASRWHAGIAQLLARVMSEGGEGDESFVSPQTAAERVLRDLIRYGRACDECDVVSYSPHDRPSHWVCEECRRWQRRLKPYRDLQTKRDFERLLRRQGGKCKVCGETDPPVPDGKLDGWHIDHDHATGKVRGILCHSCNVGLGKHEANRDVRRAFEDYLNG